MKLNRRDLLQRLLCVEPGISKKENIQQSSCILIKNGRFYTLSAEIACSIKSNLPYDLTAVVPAERFLNVLKSLEHETVDLEVKDLILILKGQGFRNQITLEADELLPIDDVELPKKKDWVNLEEGWEEAVSLVPKYTNRTSENILNQCVHVHPNWLEASDNCKMARYKVSCPVKASVLVRGTTLNSISQLGMTKGAETDNWLHFWNPAGLRVSLRKWSLEAPYPDLSMFLALRGKKIELPKDLIKASERSGWFADKDIRLSLSDGQLITEGLGAYGRFSQDLEVSYTGQKFTFSVPHKVLIEMLESHTKCEVTPTSFRINGGRYVIVTSLEVEQ